MAPINPSYHLIARTPAPPVPCAGCLDPAKVNNKVYFSLFALIFAAIVIASIWFFFHAKHGGFHWQEGDFDDWKSTVLRKKDANGNTIYSARSVVSRPRKSDRIAAKSVVGYDEKGRKGIMAVRGFGGSHSVYYSDGFTQYSGDRSDAMTSISRNEKRTAAPKIRGGYTQAPTTTDHSRRYRDRDLRDYKHEKPARVGGMNRSADGTTYDYTDRSDTATEMTETSSHAPILSSHDRKRQKAEKRAAEDAARMERKWRKEAEAAAAALAKENASSASPSSAKKSSSPQKAQTPRSAKRETSRSRSSSPKKQTPRQRDYSFSGAPDETSTVYTNTYTATSGTRTNSSYYDAYRPLAATSPAQPSPDRREQRRNEHDKRDRRTSSASPSKQHRSSRYTYADSDVTGSSGQSGGRYERVRGGEKKSKGRDVMAGYRRGMDSLGSDSE
ncbi:hypothetical protein E4T49_04286 [Aureobasidium sp. EXF-10728]|nr:hypothetical protein E4T49_04286 [Aureobasidium sp. EXF-10728]